MSPGIFIVMHRLSSCGKRVLELLASGVVVSRLSCSAACGSFVPRTQVEPMSPALEGRFLTTREVTC